MRPNVSTWEGSSTSIGDQYELFTHCWMFCFSERGKIDGSQGPDCLLNFLLLRRIDRDHADHPSCWVCVLSRPFPAVQTMPEVHPSAEMERRRRSHRVCKVRPSSTRFLLAARSWVCAPCGYLCLLKFLPWKGRDAVSSSCWGLFRNSSLHDSWVWQVVVVAAFLFSTLSCIV